MAESQMDVPELNQHLVKLTTVFPFQTEFLMFQKHSEVFACSFSFSFFLCLYISKYYHIFPTCVLIKICNDFKDKHVCIQYDGS